MSINNKNFSDPVLYLIDRYMAKLRISGGFGGGLGGSTGGSSGGGGNSGETIIENNYYDVSMIEALKYLELNSYPIKLVYLNRNDPFEVTQVQVGDINNLRVYTLHYHTELRELMALTIDLPESDNPEGNPEINDLENIFVELIFDNVGWTKRLRDVNKFTNLSDDEINERLRDLEIYWDL